MHMAIVNEWAYGAKLVDINLNLKGADPIAPELHKPPQPQLNYKQVKRLTRIALNHPDMTHVAMDMDVMNDMGNPVYVYENKPTCWQESGWVHGGEYRLIKGKKFRRAFRGWDWRHCCFDLRLYR